MEIGTLTLIALIVTWAILGHASRLAGLVAELAVRGLAWACSTSVLVVLCAFCVLLSCSAVTWVVVAHAAGEGRRLVVGLGKSQAFWQAVQAIAAAVIAAEAIARWLAHGLIPVILITFAVVCLLLSTQGFWKNMYIKLSKRVLGASRHPGFRFVVA